MERKAPAFMFYTKQWLGDDKVMLMDWDARAMHLHLMCISWQQKEPGFLEKNDKKIRKFCGNPTKRDWEERLKPQIFSAWKDDGDHWVQGGLRREYLKQLEKSNARKKAARARWDSDANASSLHKQKESNLDASSIETETATEKEVKKKEMNGSGFSVTDLNAAQTMQADISRFKPGIFLAPPEEWAGTIMRFRRYRKVESSEIIRLWDFARGESFWKNVVLGPDELFKHWDKLEIARDAERTNGQRKESASERASREFRELIKNDE